MSLLASILILIVALEHIGFLAAEMFLWTTPAIRARFGTSEDFAKASKTLAANQGLYNGFLAVGLLWSLVASEAAFALKVFFLSCVIVAGVYGAATVKKSILFVQALPAALALLCVVLAR